MHDDALNEQLRLATNEKVASYTVGIAVEKNTGAGTGTLITNGTHRYILTAAHVIEGVDMAGVKFWLRPNKGLIEKAAQDTTGQEVGRLTVGAAIPIVETRTDPKTDITILRIDDSYVFPEGPEIYHIARSFEFSSWPEEQLDGISTLIFGFPVENSRPLHTIGNNTFRFLGAASMLSKYSTKTNTEGFNGLSGVSPDKDFLFEYTADNIEPYGFSGSGVWIPTDTRGRKVWTADPVLIGVTNSYFRKANLISATKLPAIVTITPPDGKTS
ncbi:S1 family peptidase [Granulicella sp. WH15]|uniref:S1 family peptidase n=1 Tax=Granulicella sp. WH15 TaxID=2602070 RepID=UPI00136782CA|nr:S1 family peptidase [Granulicella sp. WH15]QHN03086.1 S1 family peptidase [Granulicella sp. WH15]